MPAYRTHIRLNLFLALPLLSYGLFNNNTLADAGCFSLGFIYSTFFLHPDLDLARQIKLFSIKGLLTLPFRPYSYFFHHRGLSHWPLIGTLTRLLWGGAMLWIFSILTHMNMPALEINPAILWGLAGLACADLTHSVLDWIEQIGR
jgi:uncharacterized metal-binding protein